MGTVHTVAVHYRYDYYMRRLANEFLCRNPIVATYCIMAIMFPSRDGVIDADPADGMVVPF